MMTIQVDSASATLKVDSTGVVPDIGFSTQQGYKIPHLHLTKNSSLLLSGETDLVRTSAVKITGQVRVNFSPADNIRTWKFTFIQLARTPDMLINLAGVIPEHGSIDHNLTLPPLISEDVAGKFILDSDPAFLPFASPLQFNVKPERGGGLITAEMNDHPHAFMKPFEVNNTTNAPNYIYHIFRTIELISVFVSVNERGEIVPLAHVGWQALWSCYISWLSPTVPVGRTNAKAFTVGDVTQGAPADPDLATIVKNPPTDVRKTANFWAQRSVFYMNDSRLPLNCRKENSTWTASVPRDFFSLPP